MKETLRRTLGPETNDAAEAEESDMLVGRRFFFVNNIFSRIIKIKMAKIIGTWTYITKVG